MTHFVAAQQPENILLLRHHTKQKEKLLKLYSMGLENTIVNLKWGGGVIFD